MKSSVYSKSPRILNGQLVGRLGVVYAVLQGVRISDERSEFIRRYHFGWSLGMWVVNDKCLPELGRPR